MAKAAPTWFVILETPRELTLTRFSFAGLFLPFLLPSRGAILLDMGIASFTPYYILWHYSGAIADIVRIWRNYLWFFYHFFSIPVLFKTLFSPWRRLQEEYKGGFDIENFFATKVVNTMMRLVGAFVRLAFIIVGIVVISIVFLGGLLFLAIWLALPLIALGLLIIGLFYTIHG
jgi:hypothetical protein